MRKIKTVAAAMLFVSVFAFGMGNTPAKAGLRAAWSFEEDAGTRVYDRSGNHNIGVIRGNPQGIYAPETGRADFERRAGQAGQALYLKSGSFIEIPDTDDIRLGGCFTIESRWLATNVSQVLFYKGMCETWLHPQPQYHNYHAEISLGEIMFSCTDINRTIHRISVKAPPGGGWHLLDFVYNGKALEIYIDKNLAVSREIGQVQIMTKFTQELTVGGLISAANTVCGDLRGGVDEFRIYDEALTPERMGLPLATMAEVPAPARDSTMQRALRYIGLEKERLTVTKDGRAAAVIVIRKGYTELQSVPAKELQRYIEKLTGARLPILEDDTVYSGNMILVGESRYTREMGIAADKMPGESYVMRSFPGRLVLAGHDEVLDVSNPQYEYPIPEEVAFYYKIGLKTVKNGTLNAVYAFLQDYCGVRWFMPGDLGEHIPARHDLEVSELNITDEPYRRYIIYSSEFLLRYTKSWGNRNFFGESAAAFVLDMEHDWEVLVPYRRWFASHPEWFAMNKDGVREPRPLCTSNPEMRKVALQNLKKIYAQGFEIVGLLQPDGYWRCQCPNCDAMDEYRDYPYVMGKPAERVWLFHDYLAREIQKAYPDRKVMIWGGPEPSVKIPKLSENVLIRLQLNATDPALLERWKKYRPAPPPYSAFVYWFYPEGGNMLPQSYDFIAGELKTLSAWGVNAFAFCGSGALWGLNAPVYYMMARIMRDPSQDPKAILREFCDGLFGPAAGPMHAYFIALYRGAQMGRDAAAVEQLKNNERIGRGEPVFRDFSARELYQISYPDEILEACAGPLQQARGLADTPEIKQRVEFFADAFEYTRLTSRGFMRLKECEDSSWSRASMLKLIQTVSARNKFVEDLYARWSDELPVSFFGSLEGVLYGRGELVMPFKVLKNWDTAELCSDDKNQVALSISGVGSEGIKGALKAAQYKVFPLLSPVIKAPAQYPVVIIPQQAEGGAALFNRQVSQLRDYVTQGGAVMLTHDAVGFRQYQAAFPEIGRGVGQDSTTNLVMIATNHVITAGMNAGDGWAHAYSDHIVLEKGPQGTVICADTNGRPVMVAGSFGKGRVILNGMVPGYASVKDGEKEKEPEGAELKILLNAVNWLKAR